MKRIAFVAITMLAGPVFAQDGVSPDPATAPGATTPIAPTEDAAGPGGTTGQHSLGADVLLGLPVGDLGDAAGIGIGVLGRYQYQLQQLLAITGRIGFIYHLEENNANLTQIPIFAGVKYDLTPQIFLHGEAGFNILKVSADVPGFGSVSASETELGMNLSGGFRLSPEMYIAGNLWIPSLPDVGDGFVILVSGGYDFYFFQ